MVVVVVYGTVKGVIFSRVVISESVFDGAARVVVFGYSDRLRDSRWCLPHMRWICL